MFLTKTYNTIVTQFAVYIEHYILTVYAEFLARKIICEYVKKNVKNKIFAGF